MGRVCGKDSRGFQNQSGVEAGELSVQSWVQGGTDKIEAAEFSVAEVGLGPFQGPSALWPVMVTYGL